MDWHGSYDGWYAQVRVGYSDFYNSYIVSVYGNDDTSVTRSFASYEEAIKLYDSIRYIQSNVDLKDFMPGLPNADCNGWPSERPLEREDWKIF